MKIKELVEELNKQNMDAEILMSRDEEGNGFHTIETIESDCDFVVLWPSHEEAQI